MGWLGESWEVGYLFINKLAAFEGILGSSRRKFWVGSFRGFVLESFRGYGYHLSLVYSLQGVLSSTNDIDSILIIL